MMKENNLKNSKFWQRQFFKLRSPCLDILTNDFTFFTYDCLPQGGRCVAFVFGISKHVFLVMQA